MAEHVALAESQPRKRISPGRDQLQSALCAGVIGALVLYAMVFGVIAGGEGPGGGTIALVSLGFAVLVGVVRAASPWAAMWGGLCCFTLTWWTRDADEPLLHSALLALAMLVLLTLASTRLGHARKRAKGLAEPSRGRVSSQILANLGPATLLVSPLGAYAAVAIGSSLPVSTGLLATAGLAALAEAAADTVSSEVGQALAGRSRTVLITTLRRVPRGTDGGVSLAGTLSGVAAAMVVVAAGVVAIGLPGGAAAAAFFAALLGFVADSVLGATIERRGWIGNDLVNASSSSLAGVAALLFARGVFPRA